MSESLDVDHFAVGNVIENRYRIEAVLGEGTTGRVLLAKDARLGEQLVALKFLHSHLLFSRESYGRFRAETRITMSLNHPNILRTFGLSQHESGDVYLTMEYLDGETLAEYIAANGKDQDERRFQEKLIILRDIASALQYAHQCGVIHRDLKPANILLDSDCRPKIADFGLAQMVSLEARYTGYGNILGTPLYMSPEQLRSEAVDGRSDMYSFGILAYELLTGSCPFLADSFLALAELHLSAPLPRFSCPLWLEELVRRATSKTRLDRFASMSEIVEVLNEHCRIPPLSQGSSEKLYSSGAHFMSGTKPKFQYRAQRVLSRWAVTSCLMGWLSFWVLLPHINRGVAFRAAGYVLRIERLVGVQLNPLRILVNTDLDLKDPLSICERAKGVEPDRFHVRALIRSGVDPNFICPNGRYPLAWSVEKGDINTILEFLEAGADLNLLDQHGHSVLAYALRLETVNARVINILLANGANPNVAGKATVPPLAYLLSNGDTKTAEILLQRNLVSLELPTNLDFPLLHLAIRLGSERVVTLLLEQGVSITERDSRGRTALEFAATLQDLPQIPNIIGLLHRAQAQGDEQNSVSEPRQDA